MAAGLYNILLQRGSDFSLQLQLKQSAGGPPVDLTGSTVRGAVKRKFSDATAALVFTCTVTDAVNGKILISATKEAIAAIDAYSATDRTIQFGIFDIEVVYPARTDRVLEGSVAISQEVTV